MKLATRIFNRKRGYGEEDYYVTSPFGKRVDPINGKIAFHNGVDYGTHGKKWEQFALEDGIVEFVGLDLNGAKYVEISYPRLGYRCFHAHLDKIYVKKGQSVNHSTKVGDTGETGRVTAIHLHLGVKYIGSNEWVDPESFDYKEESTPTPNTGFPFAAIVKKGSNLYTENGTRYKFPARADRTVEVLGEKGNRYKVYGNAFTPNIVYVDKGNVKTSEEKYPFNAIIKKGSPLFNEDGNQYKYGARYDRQVIVEGELNNRYRIRCTKFTPNVVYCDKTSIVK